MMDNVHPKWAFLAYGISGFIVAICCIFLSKEAENEVNEGEVIEITEWSSALEEGQTPSQAVAKREEIERAKPKRGEEGFCYNFKKNMGQIGWALKRKEIYCVVIYFILDGLTNPSFSDFSYFFLLNVIGVSKFMFAMIVLIGQICSVIGVMLYEKFLKGVEVRTVLFWNVILAIIGTWLNYCFAMRWNLSWGISDYFFLIFTDVVFGAISTAFGLLPIMALFAKITPRGIEGTMFAFLTGTANFDSGVMQPMLGAWINSQFVGVNKDDQSGYPTLCLISFFCSFIGFALLPLIPLKKDIEEANLAREKQAEIDKIESDKRKAARLAEREKNKAEK